MTIIAIDCGASFIKAARFSEKSENIECVEIRNTPKYDGKTLRIKKTVDVVRELIEKLSFEDSEIKVGLSTEMHGFLAADKEGAPLTDYISWQDECGYEMFDSVNYIETVRNKLSEKEILSTGMPVKAGLPNVNLFYQLQNQLCDIPKSKIFFYTLGDYLIRVLSGEMPYIHISNAAATGLYDVSRKRWNDAVIYKLGMQDICFPEIVEEAKVIECDINGKKICFFPAIGDQQAALFGSNFCDEKSVSLNFGTGAQVSIISNELILSDKYQTRPYFNGLFLRTIPHIPSGRALNVYFNFVKQFICMFTEVDDDSIWKCIMDEAESDVYCSLDIDMSFFSNAITRNTSGSISNIEEDKFSIGNLFHSIYKKMAVNAKEMFIQLNGNEIDHIVFSGGVVRKSKVLRELMMQEFDIQNATVSESETLKGVYKYIKNNEREK